MSTQNQVGFQYPKNLPYGRLLYNNLSFTNQTGTASVTYASVASLFSSGFLLTRGESFDQPVDGRLRYTGIVPASFLVNAVYGGSQNATLGSSIAIYKNGTIITDAEDYMSAPSAVPGVFKTVISNLLIDLTTNDYVEIFVKRNNTTGNLTLYSCSLTATLYSTY